MILSLTTIRKHHVNGTGENLLRRHQCAIHVAEMLHFMWYPTSNMTSTSVPAPLHKLVKHYNKEYLKKPNDLPIVTKRLWCIIFFKRYSLVELRQMSHEFIYIQERYLDADEVKTNTKIRRRPASKAQIGRADIYSLQTNISIHLPSGKRYFYGTRDLHFKKHGSTATCAFEYHHELMDRTGIETNLVTPRSGNIEAQKRNDIFVVYDDSPEFEVFEKKSNIGLASMQYHIVMYLLKVSETDGHRAGKQIHKGSNPLSLRLRWGFGREQKIRRENTKGNCIHWKLHGQKMPTINSEPFLKLPRMLRLELRILFEYATAMLKNKMSDMLPKYN